MGQGAAPSFPEEIILELTLAKGHEVEQWCLHVRVCVCMCVYVVRMCTHVRVGGHEFQHRASLAKATEAPEGRHRGKQHSPVCPPISGYNDPDLPLLHLLSLLLARRITVVPTSVMSLLSFPLGAPYLPCPRLGFALRLLQPHLQPRPHSLRACPLGPWHSLPPAQDLPPHTSPSPSATRP